jgi:hypothetical protein
MSSIRWIIIKNQGIIMCVNYAVALPTLLASINLVLQLLGTGGLANAP